jgi:type IV pilus assembly protein PilE
MTHKHAKGFTLLELMIVVAVVAILGAIAYPSYTSSVLKGKRAQARTALVELLQQQERYMTQKNCYLAFSNTNGTVAAIASTCGATTSSAVPFKTFSGDSATNTAYRLSAGTCPAPVTGATVPTIQECVQVTAQPVKSDPEVGNLSMTSTGVKSCTGTASSSNFSLCWP